MPAREIRRETIEAPSGQLELTTLMGLDPFDNNVYLLTDRSSSRCLIVDASEAEPILDAVQGLQVEAILITHGHRDHHKGLVALHDRRPAPVLVGAPDAEMLPLTPERLLRDGDVVQLGPHALNALATPGHTPGGTCFTLGSLLFSGDTLFPGGPGNTRRETNPLGDFERIMGSLRTRLFVLPDQTRVLPGHGEPTTIGRERPHLDEWQARGW